MDKQDVLEWVGKLPDGVTFKHDVIWTLRGALLTYLPPEKDGSVTIYFNEKPLEFDHTEVTGSEIMRRADKAGLLRDWERVLIEEMPNATSTIIGQGCYVRLRNHMKFSAIGR